MAAVKELLRAEADGALGFGDYTLSSKTKLDGFEFQGDVYKVKTFSEITKLEKNGMFVYESVPGTAVEDLKLLRERFLLKYPVLRMRRLHWSWKQTANMLCIWTM